MIIIVQGSRCFLPGQVTQVQSWCFVLCRMLRPGLLQLRDLLCTGHRLRCTQFITNQVFDDPPSTGCCRCVSRHGLCTSALADVRLAVSPAAGAAWCGISRAENEALSLWWALVRSKTGFNLFSPFIYHVKFVDNWRSLTNVTFIQNINLATLEVRGCIMPLFWPQCWVLENKTTLSNNFKNSDQLFNVSTVVTRA